MKPLNSGEATSNQLHADEFTLQSDALNLHPRDFNEAMRELQYAQQILNMKNKELVGYEKREEREEKSRDQEQQRMDSIAESLSHSVKQNTMLTAQLMAPQGRGEPTSNNGFSRPVPATPYTEPNQNEEDDISSEVIPLGGSQIPDKERDVPETPFSEVPFAPAAPAVVASVPPGEDPEEGEEVEL